MMKSTTHDGCLAREELKRYLGGWIDPSAGEQVEKHLNECAVCDQTISELENETAIELPLARRAGTNSGSTEHSPAETGDRTLQRTIDSIKQWDTGRALHEANRLSAANTLSGDFGNYELAELIGRGGMAEVYRARHKRLQRDVAIKLIRVPRWQMAESLNRIEREMQAIGRLKHPAIVSAMDAGEHDGVQFLVTEFIDGLDVGKIARATGPLKIADACEIVRVAALGLDHAHAQGIVHRDIKPSNLMLDKNGGVKILDFGLVHMEGWTGMAAEVTTVGQLLGTLDYMAPEQADRVESVDHRSDVYSLGATLFRLLCGRAPYAASSNQSPLEKLRLLATERPPRVATLRPDLSTELAAIIDRCLDRDPNHRPASAAHLAESLEPFCNDHDLATLVAEANSNIKLGAESMNQSISPVVPSLAGLAWHQTKPRLAKSTARVGHLWKPLIAAALCVAAVAAGIIVVLETQKGRVIIESDSSNLHVELVADGAIRKEIELVPGENSTRIYAGRYEVRIDDGTDRYSIDQNAFYLKRGETVVAKITVDDATRKADIAWSDNRSPIKKPAAEDASQKSARLLKQQTPAAVDQAKSIGPSQPVYEGKSLEEWLRIVEFENSHEVRQSAIYPIVSLAQNDPDALVAVRLFLMEHIKRNNSQYWIGTLVRSIGLNEAQFGQLTGLIQTAEPKDVINLFSIVIAQKTRYHPYDLDGLQNEIRQVVKRPDWGTKNLNREQFGELLGGTIEAIRQGLPVHTQERGTFGNVDDEQIGQPRQFLKFCMDTPQFGPEFLFAYRPRSDSVIPSTEMVFAVAALRRLEDEGLTDEEQMILLGEIAVAQVENVNGEMGKQLLSNADRVLLKLAQSPEILLQSNLAFSSGSSDRNTESEWAITQVDPKVLGLTHEVVTAGLPHGPVKNTDFRNYWNSNSYFRPANPALEVINLLFRSSSKENKHIPTDGLKAIMEATKAQGIELQEKLVGLKRDEENEAYVSFDHKGFHLRLAARRGGFDIRSFASAGYKSKSESLLDPNTILAAILHQAASRTLEQIEQIK